MTEPYSPEAWNHGESEGNHPQMAQLLRLVKYYNLPSLAISSIRFRYLPKKYVPLAIKRCWLGNFL